MMTQSFIQFGTDSFFDLYYCGPKNGAPVRSRAGEVSALKFSGCLLGTNTQLHARVEGRRITFLKFGPLY